MVISHSYVSLPEGMGHDLWGLVFQETHRHGSSEAFEPGRLNPDSSARVGKSGRVKVRSQPLSLRGQKSTQHLDIS